MNKQTNCPLCGNAGAKEIPVSGQDKYEIRCDTCTIYHLTSGQDTGFINLPKRNRLKLSAHAREHYEKTKTPVHFDYVDNFKHLFKN